MPGKQKTTARVYLHTMQVGDREIETKVYLEARPTVRFSIGKNEPILRMPLRFNQSEMQHYLTQFETWVRGRLHLDEGLIDRYTGKAYQDGDTLKVGQREYKVFIDTSNHKNHSGRINNGVIHLKIADHTNERDRRLAVKQLLSRLIGNDYKPFIWQRVHDLNQLHFQKPIRDVRLKYNHSNWGSCSTLGIVNLSTRLLFAPQEVIDYVIVHELAHLVEMNHSQKFWDILDRIMPDYPQYEAWLKENGPECDF